MSEAHAGDNARFCRFGRLHVVATGDAGPEDRGRFPIAIYAIIDPRDRKVVYVGQTSNPDNRLSQHIRDGANNESLKLWLAEMKAQGVQPKLVTIARSARWLVNDAERYWIGYFRTRGHIFNEDEGGRVNGRSKPRAKKKDAWGYEED